jgi:hypothetical protein
VGEKIGGYNRRFAREWCARAQAIAGVGGVNMSDKKVVAKLLGKEMGADLSAMKFAAGKVIIR